MSDDQIKVQFGADIAPLTGGNEAARQSVSKTVQAMKADFATLATSTRQSFEGIGQQARNVTARMSEIGEQTEIMSHSAMVGLGELARGIGKVAESGQLGAFSMREFSGAAMRLGTMLGPAGGLAGIFVLLAGVVVETFTKARDEMKKTEEQFKTSIAGLANTGRGAELEQKARELYFGTPYDEQGNLRGQSPGAPDAFKGSLADMRSRMAFLQARLANPPGENLLEQSFAARQLQDDIAKLKPDLDAAEQKFREIKTALDVMKSQPPDMKGLLPVRITAPSPDGNPLPQSLRDAIAAAKAQMALGDVDSNEMGINKTLEKMRQAYEAAGREYVAMTLRNQGKQAENEGQLNATIEKQLQHRAEVNAKVLLQMANDGKKWVSEQAAHWDGLFKGITTSWGQAVRTIQSGHDSLKNFWRDMWHDMVRNAALGEMQILESHLAMWLARKQITTKGVLEEVGVYLASALKSIAISAAVAAAGAWSALASIPLVGPFLAPTVAAGTLAGVIALGSHIRSAAGGYDIPAGLNPVTQLHAQEMVLPADLANRIRGMTDGGGNHYHINVQAWDSRDVKKFIMNNRDHLTAAVKTHVRNGGGRNT